MLDVEFLRIDFVKIKFFLVCELKIREIYGPHANLFYQENVWLKMVWEK